MARTPRIQLDGAIYHVINRGNYRQDLFAKAGTADAFERTLFEACDRCGWEMSAYCVMSNHYHLALTTPKGNLEGVHWLQSTFGNRFHHFFDERGHVFQGRYKAILVEPGIHLVQLVNYIHLNPVRAGLTGVSNLESYRWSSFGKFIRKKNRPTFLRCEDWLTELGGLRDTPSGWRKCREYLASVNELDPKRREEMFGQMCRGWVLGTQEYRKALHADFKKMQVARDWGGEALRELNEMEWEALRELNEMEWEEVANDCLRRLEKTEDDVAGDLKSAEWKSALAWWMKRNSSVSNRWLSVRLNMGPPAMVSRLAGTFGKMPARQLRDYEKRFTA